MRTLLCLANCITAVSAVAQHLPNPLFTGNSAYTHPSSHPLLFLSNPAALASCTQTAAGLYAENRYGLRELSSYTAAVQWPLDSSGIGLVTTYAGSVEFNRSQVSLAYGRSLGRIHIGARFNYTMVRMAGYGSDGSIGFEFGSCWKVTEKLTTGIQVSNPPVGKAGKEAQQPSVYTMAAGYTCSDQLFLTAAIIKEENKTVNLRAGLQYTLLGKWLLWLGMNSSPAMPVISTGWQWKQVRILVTGSFHTLLGASTGIGIIFFGKKKD